MGLHDKTFAKPIHAVQSNYGYDTAQARSPRKRESIGKRNLQDLEPWHIIVVPMSFAKVL